MVKKGNAPTPHAHFHKHWNPCAAQRGHVRTHFEQGTRRSVMRVKRLKKAARIFPRPLSGPIRPIVRCSGQRYNMKGRFGQGFTFAECKKAGINRRYAKTIGIAVDHRRTNHCEESLELNANRLKTYLSNLILWPRNRNYKLKDKTGLPKATKEEMREVMHSKSQDLSHFGQAPRAKIALKQKREAPRELTADEKKRCIYQFLRKVQRDQKLVGVRIKRQKAKATRQAEKKAK
eukprot:NODE_1815_length_832_cov_711.936143_g1432_i0.p1 GENE.NODE_1815_length_832_cov_711.936143_g1432_i0~~NODE_1815_length_832_cov_711.936143_g1432_i0.p1  ORF type:complete len:253 (+),score=74.76 NODE_1815_length_832_cov_711.936143_g1432_i0:61-759(+)